MSGLLIELGVGAVLGFVPQMLVLFLLLAIRSIRKDRKSGGGCNGDCASCGGCHHHIK